jgi:exosome complex component MTR3
VQAAERSCSAALQAALEASVQLDKFPKSAVDVYGIVLESGGSDTSALITAASMALADAHIELFDIVTACDVGLLKGRLLLDPSGQEAARQAGGLLLAMMPARNEVTQMRLEGDFSAAQTKAAMQLAMGGCLQLRQLVHAQLVQAVGAAFEQL